MKLSPDFIKCRVDGETLVVPVAGADFHGLVRGNGTVGDILDCLTEDTTEEKIVDSLLEKYNGERAVIEKDVADIISRLKKIGAIEE